MPNQKNRPAKIRCGDYSLYLRGDNRSHCYYVSFSLPGGNRIRQSTGFSDPKMAKSEGERLFKMYLDYSREPSAFLTVDEVVGEFLQYSKVNLKSHGSNVSRAKYITEFFDKGYYISNIGRGEISKFRTWLQSAIKPRGEKKRATGSAINRVLVLFRRIINFAKEEGLYNGDNPFIRIKLHREKKTREPLDIKTVLGILRLAKTMREEVDAHIKEREKKGIRYLIEKKYTSKRYFFLYVAGCLFAGFRGGEWLNARMDDLLNNEGCFYLRLRGETTKSARPRLVPLPDILVDLINSYPSDREYIIDVRRHGEKLKNTYTFSRCWTRVREKLGVSIQGHQLRHTFATEALEINTDLITIQETLGHQSLDMVRLYAKSSLSKRKGAIERVARKILEFDDDSIIPIRKKA